VFFKTDIMEVRGVSKEENSRTGESAISIPRVDLQVSQKQLQERGQTNTLSQENI